MRVQVALKLGSCTNAQLLVNGDRYVTYMTGNSHFADEVTVALVTKVKTGVTTFRAAINAPMSDTKSDNMKIARDALERDITRLGGKVVDIANDPAISDAMREEIVHSAGMEVKDQAHRGPRVFEAKNTGFSGTVSLTARGGADANNWEYTEDIINFTGRIAVEPTTRAEAIIPNLKRGTEYAFFHKAVRSTGNSGWEGPVLLIVM